MNDQLPAWTTLTVTTRTPAADGVVSLTLRRPDGGVLPAWTPGAHIDVLLEGDDGEEGGLIRQYSLCGRPADRAGWQIAVLREPRGRGGSAYVHDHLREGTTVRVRGPRNTFPLRPAARHLFIAGGVGITPILPMVEAAEAAGDDWLLLYGGRTRASMAFLDRLAPHGDRVLIRPQDEYGLLDLAAHLGVPEEGTLVHACGPEPLLLAVQEQCAGWPPARWASSGSPRRSQTGPARPRPSNWSSLVPGSPSPCRRTARYSKPSRRQASRWTSRAGKARAAPVRRTYWTANPTIATRC